jgi:CheY-like chemotaxis protein
MEWYRLEKPRETHQHQHFSWFSIEKYLALDIQGEVCVYLKASPLEGKAYLVVDDFGDMRSMMRNLLMSCGVQDITPAANGTEALEAMKKRRFDVVLCDYNLGTGKDGQQVLEEARHRNLISLGCVFLMVTAENTREMVMGAVEYEPDSYLTKPFNKELLKTRLEKLIARKADLLPVEQALNRHDTSTAVTLLDQKIAEKPANSSDLRKLKGEILLNAGEIAAARKVYESVLAIRVMPWARLGLGKTLYLEKRYQEAMAVFQTLIEEQATYTAAYDWLAKCCKALDQLSEAQSALQTAAKLSPKAVRRQQLLGEIALQNQDQETALAAFGKAVKHGRHSVYKHPSAYANLAKVTATCKQGDQGLKLLRDMQREFQRDPQANFYLATAESEIQEGMGNAEASRASLERAAELYEGMDHLNNTDCSLEMAKTYQRLGMEDKAVELMQNAASNNHTDDELLNDIKQTMRSMGVKPERLNSIDQIRREVAELNNRGVELAKKGQLDEAIALLEKTAERMPGNRVINLNAALVLLLEAEQHTLTQKSDQKIDRYLQRVASVEPDNRTLSKLQKRFNIMHDKSGLEG